MGYVVGGHLPAMFSGFGDALAKAQSGAIRLLAVASEQRAAQAPDVPTIAESGFPGFKAPSWWGLMAPAGTPKDIVNRLAAEVGNAVRDPKIIEQMTAFGVDPLGNGPNQFSAMVHADIASWAEAVKLAGLQAK